MGSRDKESIKILRDLTYNCFSPGKKKGGLKKLQKSFLLHHLLLGKGGLGVQIRDSNTKDHLFVLCDMKKDESHIKLTMGRQ